MTETLQPVEGKIVVRIPESTFRPGQVSSDRSALASGVLSRRNDSMPGRKVALTGGMACGKSTALGMFADLGWHTIQSDRLAFVIYREDAFVRQQLKARFGRSVLNADESDIERRNLGKAVFGDPEALRFLEELMHPRVGQRWQEALADSPQTDHLVEIPLLFEKALDSHFDCTVSLITSELTQRERLASRNLNAAEVQARLERQLPLAEKARRADLVLSNSGSLSFLDEQVIRADHILRPIHS